jgi:hypothetical protein
MISDFLDRDEIARYVDAVRCQLEAGRLHKGTTADAAHAIGRGSADPAAAVIAALPDDDTGSASSGEAGLNSPFFSRDPTVSLLQTTLEDEARKNGVVHEPKEHGLFGHIACAVESIDRCVDEKLHPEKFSTDDADWVTKIGEATLGRLAKGNHPFNHAPAEYTIDSDDARIVVVGDWASGLPRAQAVATFMAEEIADAIDHGRAVHVIHLGDVYYSGDEVEVRRRVLAEGMWPVTVEQSRAGVTSWALNGNHDMYCGGWGFFDTLLGDERFANQRSPDGKGTSFFRIKTPSWDLVGLDTSWDPEVLCLGKCGVLADPQAAVLQGWAAESDRKLMLLSHHQLISCYDLADIGTVLPHKLAALIDKRRIAAWLWGHEHRCMGFSGSHGIPFLRCIGHGGIPVPAAAAKPDGAIPAPGIWQELGSFVDKGRSWNSFGFAILDFDGPRVTVRYRNDDGDETRSETII